MKKIVFHTGHLGLRGTEVALFDYAYFNQAILKNQSIISYAVENHNNHKDIIKKFESHFETYGYNDFEEVDQLILRCDADLLYAQKAGVRDPIVSKVVPTIVHAVFPVRPREFHGAVFAYISDWLSDTFSAGRVPAVPYIVRLPEFEDWSVANLRKELAIPENATVFGCHGGSKSFDLPFVKEQAIPEILAERDDIYFIFLNIEPFIEHARVKFLEGTSNEREKYKFICTADAMLHGRKQGESFGLACAEFSICNRPVITYSRSKERHHIKILGEKAFTYRNSTDLKNILNQFDRVAAKNKNWDCYSEQYSPEKVMRLFDRRLIQPACARGIADHPGLKLSLYQKIITFFNRLRIKWLKL